MSLCVLGLDLGTHTGYALVTDGKVTDSGVADLSIKRGESPGMRFWKFNKWLWEYARFDAAEEAWDCPFDLCAYENPHFRGGWPTEVLVGMSTRVQEFCAQVGIDHTTVHTATLKKWATVPIFPATEKRTAGKGNAKKPDMVRAARFRTGLDVTSDDEADAILAALWAAATYGKGGKP